MATEDSLPPVNALIWISVKPIIKLAIPATLGYILTKTNLFPTAGSRATSHIIMRVTLPALLFSKLVVSFSSENAKAIGPIFLVAIFYQVVSLNLGLFVRFLFPVRRDFRYGILAAATWSNWGDLPTAVVATITLSKPFNGALDSDLSIAYVAIFILVFYITLFPMGGVKLIQWDYTRVDHQDSKTYENTRGFDWRNAASRLGHLFPTKEINHAATDAYIEEEKNQPVQGSHTLTRASSNLSAATNISATEVARAVAAPSIKDTSLHNRRLQARQALLRSKRPSLKTIPGSRAPSIHQSKQGHGNADNEESCTKNYQPAESVAPTSNSVDELDQIDERPIPERVDSFSTIVTPRQTLLERIKGPILAFLGPLVQPPTIALALGLLFAFIPKLKALVIHVDGASFNPVAPDGQPPLSVLLETANFLGGASVPLGLIVLGSAIARLNIPRPFSALPIGSILGLAISKMVILPIIGFFFVKFLAERTSLVDENNHVLRFVLVFFSCVPSATTQVVMTQLYCPPDVRSNEDILASYLIVQYMIFVVSSVILTVFTLQGLY